MTLDKLQTSSIWNSELNRICFDPDSGIIIGKYLDELSCYRARKIWSELLEEHFFLQKKTDFEIEITNIENENFFELKCNFQSACGRYAFWRITNYQSPEVQYLMETAHIPFCESRQEEILMTPDLCSIYEERKKTSNNKNKNFLSDLVMSAVNKIKDITKNLNSID